MSQRLEFEPTIVAALASIDAIQPTAYARTRNHLDGALTRLSPYLTHGFVQVPQVIDRLSQRCQLALRDKIVFELAWREYFQHLWRHWGEDIFTARRPPPAASYSPHMPPDVLQGCTGVPVIDAAVRTLYQTGYLHNHARMWLASYLVHLRKTDWKAGAAWMYRHLLDGDLASNTLSWQWVAGTLTGKPYLFNAENVERYAPQWPNFGTVLDTEYEALDQLARQSGNCGPQNLGADRVDEPPVGSMPDRDNGPMQHAGGQVWLMHPWALGNAPPGRVIGWIEPGFHERFAWSEARWQFVLGRMRSVCEGFVVGDATMLRQRFVNTRLMTLQTYNPGYAQAILGAGIVAQPVPRCFDDPDSAMPSFSRFWQHVVPSVDMAGTGKADQQSRPQYPTSGTART